MVPYRDRPAQFQAMTPYEYAGTYKLTFGKYKWQTLAYVREHDPSYLGWALKKIDWDWFIELVERFLALRAKEACGVCGAIETDEGVRWVTTDGDGDLPLCDECADDSGRGLCDHCGEHHTEDVDDLEPCDWVCSACCEDGPEWDDGDDFPPRYRQTTATSPVVNNE